MRHPKKPKTHSLHWQVRLQEMSVTLPTWSHGSPCPPEHSRTTRPTAPKIRTCGSCFPLIRNMDHKTGTPHQAWEQLWEDPEKKRHRTEHQKAWQDKGPRGGQEYKAIGSITWAPHSRPRWWRVPQNYPLEEPCLEGISTDAPPLGMCRDSRHVAASSLDWPRQSFPAHTGDLQAKVTSSCGHTPVTRKPSF